MNKAGIAVFGGAFNPPTVAHIDLAKQILKEMKEIEKVNKHTQFYKVTKESLQRLATTKCNFEEGE